MAVTTLSFTMRNEGFRSQFVAPYSKAVLVTVILDDARCILDMVVLGIPLTAIRKLEHQNVFHYRRDQVPERILVAIDEHCERRVMGAVQRMAADFFEALDEPMQIQ